MKILISNKNMIFQDFKQNMISRELKDKQKLLKFQTTVET